MMAASGLNISEVRNGMVVNLTFGNILDVEKVNELFRDVKDIQKAD